MKALLERLENERAHHHRLMERYRLVGNRVAEERQREAVAAYAHAYLLVAEGVQ